MLRFVQFILIISIFFCTETQSQRCTPSPQFIPKSLNFSQCLLDVQSMSMNERRDSGCFSGNGEAGILTLDGCMTICGPGHDFWQLSDTFNRLSLLVLPTLFLIAHLAYPTAGWQSCLSIPCHAIGDPIGSLRSLLTRFEAHRRLSREAERAYPDSRVSMALSTIAAAYEELGWQRISVDVGSLTVQEEDAIRHASHELSVARPASTFNAMISIVALVLTLTTAIVRTAKQLNQHDTRIFNETGHTIACVCVLFITIPQVWFSARLGTFTTSSGAIRTLRALDRNLSHVTERQTSLLPPIQLAYCPVAPQQRYTWLITYSPKWTHAWTRELFSHCPLDQISNAAIPTSSRNSLTRQWQASSKLFGVNAMHLGINSFWRPCKHLPHNEHGRGQVQIMFISIFWVMFGSGIPALFLSATSHIDKRHVGIGCRSLSWITVMGIWLSSFVCGSLIRLFCCHASGDNPYRRLKLIYRWTVFKDFVAMTLVITLVLLVQIGRWNNCWCRSSLSSPPTVNLMPYSGVEWTTEIFLWAGLPSAGLCVSLGFILWIELLKRDSNGSIMWFQKEHGSPLCKSGKAMEKEFKEDDISDDSEDSEDSSSKGPRVQEREFIKLPQISRRSVNLESDSLMVDARIARAYCRE